MKTIRSFELLAGVVGACCAACGGSSARPVDAGVDASVEEAPEAVVEAGEGVDAGEVGDAFVEALDSVEPALVINVLVGDVPSAGAVVVLDTPEGVRTVRTADAKGQAVFSQVGPGQAVLTAYLTGHPIVSLVGPLVGVSSQDVRLPEAPVRPPQVEVYGTVNDPAFKDILTVTSSSGTSGGGVTPDWSLTVNRDEPFTLVARAWHEEAGLPPGRWQNEIRWKRVDHEAVHVATRVDIDLLHPDAPATSTGSIPIPGSPGDVLHDAGKLHGQVFSWSGLYLGALARIERAGDGQAFNFDWEFLDFLPEDQVFTRYSCRPISVGIDTAFAVAGYPADGPVVSSFLAVPRVTSPAGPSQPAADPIAWTWADAGKAALTLFVVNADEALSTWQIRLADGVTSLVLPDLPPGVDPDAVFGVGKWVTLVLRACAPFPAPHDDVCRRFAAADSFALRRPDVPGR